MNGLHRFQNYHRILDDIAGALLRRLESPCTHSIVMKRSTDGYKSLSFSISMVAYCPTSLLVCHIFQLSSSGESLGYGSVQHAYPKQVGSPHNFEEYCEASPTSRFHYDTVPHSYSK